MDKILITGALGQIGSELSLKLADKYGRENVIISDLKNKAHNALKHLTYYQLDVMKEVDLEKIVTENNITVIYHLAAILSANGEQNPILCWNVNMQGTINVLEQVRKHSLKRVFVPSSIAVWGEWFEKQNTPQASVLRPTTMYGVTKVAGEAFGNYYFQKFGIDVRGLRYPGIISSETLPGGGTTDYAVEIFYKAIEDGKYDCFLKEDTTLPMMYMDDCINATISLMEANLENLITHADYNLAGVSFSPAELAEEIKKHIPEFEIEYNPDFRQKIAESWPQTIDDSYARKDWNWSHKFGLEEITKTMIERLKEKLEKN